MRQLTLLAALGLGAYYVATPWIRQMHDRKMVARYPLVSGQTVIDFGSIKLRLERQRTAASGLSRLNDTPYFKVREALVGGSGSDDVSYLVTDLPNPSGSPSCERAYLLLRESPTPPGTLQIERWRNALSEPSRYPELKRVPSFNEAYRVEAEELRTSDGAFPVLDCGAGRCIVDMEIHKPLYARYSYEYECGVERASGQLKEIKRQLVGRIVP